MRPPAPEHPSHWSLDSAHESMPTISTTSPTLSAQDSKGLPFASGTYRQTEERVCSEGEETESEKKEE